MVLLEEYGQIKSINNKHEIMMKNLLEKLSLALLVVVFGVAGVSAQEVVFTESDETVVMEAEHYYGLKEGSAGGDYNYTGGLWAVKSTSTGYTGDGYIQAPDFDGGIGGDADIVGLSPAVIFRVNFTNPGEYYWYARCSYDDWDSDSYHLGAADSLLFKKMNPWSQIGENYGSWGWNYNTAANDEAVIVIPTAGEHDIVVYMREPNFKLDKIILTTDPGIAPTELDEVGPAETSFTTGISESLISNSVNVFPNPFQTWQQLHSMY